MLAMLFFSVLFFISTVSFVFAQVTDDTPASGRTAGGYCPGLTSTFERGATDATTGGQVTRLQEFLTDYYDINTQNIVVGVFGRSTQAYVVKFQQEQGLPAYGVIGTLTRATIARVCVSSGVSNTPPAPTRNTNTTTGSTNPASTSTPVNTNTTRPQQGTLGCSINSSTPTVPFDTAFTLTWSSQYASSAELTPTFGRVLPTGSRIVHIRNSSGSTVTVPFTLTVTNGVSTARCTTSVTASANGIPANTSSSSESPSCVINMDRRSYTVGDTVSLTWRSSNATYATWLPGGSGGDSFRMASDRLETSGSVGITANVAGNPVVVMRVVGPGGSSTCSKVVPVSAAQTQASCPQVTTPSCANGTLISRGNDGNGCSLGYACQSAQTTTSSVTASPTSGSAPLAVTFRVSATDSTETSGVYYTIVFGDNDAAGFARASNPSLTHTYRTAGTYTAVVSRSTQCSSWECLGPRTTVGTVTISVSGSTQVQCPVVPPGRPNCFNETPITRYDANGCVTGYGCGIPTQPSSCPILPPSRTLCSNGGDPTTGVDVNGCVISYGCVQANNTKVKGSGMPQLASAMASMNNPLEILARTLSALFER